MASDFHKFASFAADCARGVHDLGNDTLRVMLTNRAPAPEAKVKADIAEITARSGYRAGGKKVSVRITDDEGMFRIYGDNMEFRADGGSLGPFRYAVLYNDTTPQGALLGWWDYGESLSLGDGERVVLPFVEDGLVLEVSAD